MKRLPIIAVVLMFALPLFAGKGASPQQFLIRSDYLTMPGGIHKANAYRVREYTPYRYTKFMGLGVTLHPVAIASLACVEKMIKSSCTDDYTPTSLSGWRPKDTYRGDEISNHVFGIAVDIDPERNPCCGCVKPWSDSPRCPEQKSEVVTTIGDYELPECWIAAFKANGWYWLGDDPQLRDTMHFEFLAKPEEAGCE